MTLTTEARPAPRDHDGAGKGGGFSGLLWLTWRQHRWALVSTFVLAAVLTGWMMYLSAEITDLWHQCHDTRCPEMSPEGQRIGGAPFGLARIAGYLSHLVQYVPLLIGVFIGVPLLSREHEQRTLLLVWSQDISPARWLWAKLGLLGLFVAVVTAPVAGAADHLEHVVSNVAAGSLFEYGSLLNMGMLPLTISLSWFAVGVAAGAAIRRTLPAVFAVVAGFIGLMLLVQFRYPTLMPPLSAYRRLGGPDDGLLRDNALLVDGGIINFGSTGLSGVYDASGRQLTGVELERLCPPTSATTPESELACFMDHQLQQHLLYQPGSRIPDVQLIIGAGYLTLAVLALATVWLIVRRTNLSAG